MGQFKLVVEDQSASLTCFGYSFGDNGGNEPTVISVARFLRFFPFFFSVYRTCGNKHSAF